MRKNAILVFMVVAFFLTSPFIQTIRNLDSDAELIIEQTLFPSSPAPPLVPSNSSELITGWNSSLPPLPNYDVIEMDSYGNLYVAGSFTNTISFGSYTATLGSGLRGVYVAKMNVSGNWEFLANNTPVSSIGDIADIDISPSGEVVVTGRIHTTSGSSGRVYFGPNLSIGGSGISSFAAMIDSTGSWSWVKTLEPNNHKYGTGGKIFFDSSDNSSIVYSGNCLQNSQNPQCSLNLMKFNETGTDFGYISVFSSYYTTSANPSGMVIDSQGSIIISGTISSSNQISCGSNQVTPANSYELFIAKLDISWKSQSTNSASYTCDWLKISETNGSSGSNYISGGDLTIDENDNLGFIGQTSAQTEFAGHNYTGYYPLYTHFFQMFHPNGTSYNWSLNTTNVGSTDGGFSGLVYNGSGKYVISGLYSTTSFGINIQNKSNNSSFNPSYFPTIPSGSYSHSQFAMIISDNSSILDTLFVNKRSSFSQMMPTPMSILPSGDILMTIGSAFGVNWAQSILHNGETITINSSAYRVPVTIKIEARDFDSDGLVNEYDHCAMGVSGWNRTNTSDIDQDGCKDLGPENSGRGEDIDDDNDNISDPSTAHPTNFGLADRCPSNFLNWTSTSVNDRDGDGCRDLDEDIDYDDDGVLNDVDDCPNGSMYWSGLPYYDHDSDGCADFYVSLYYTALNLHFSYPEEDFDDDNDGIQDSSDNCQRGVLNWTRTNQTDYDGDGCEDSTEDSDDDSGTIPDLVDLCPRGKLNWISNQATTDYDIDGCIDSGEDLDDDNDGLTDLVDNCSRGDLYWVSTISTDYDTDGCKDSQEDDDDDDDGILDNLDSCPKGILSWDSSFDDYDSDGCRDFDEDDDDDNDGVHDTNDSCPYGQLNWLTNLSTDFDGDGCLDLTEDLDDDDDGFEDEIDRCSKGTIGYTPTSENDWDNDGCLDSTEDLDDDNDGVVDVIDDCSKGSLNWTSDLGTDHDGDGCQDLAAEDIDDDNDGVMDFFDDCSKGALNWTSDPGTDHDGDGCRDSTEDNDDDNDAVLDINDACQAGDIGWISNQLTTDYDSDGCQDSSEDTDDDNDGVSDNHIDACTNGDLEWISNSSNDYDGDGCKDETEDLDDDNDGITDLEDTCTRGDLVWASNPNTDHDGDGCRDSTEDNDDDNDAVLDINDACQAGDIGWISNQLTTDYDSDGCQDSSEDTDDDNDGVSDNHIDACTNGDLEWISNSSNDYDGDGCKDETEDLDDDNDGIFDIDDSCEKGQLNWQSSNYSDNDGDGCQDSNEDSDDDNDGLEDRLDDCNSGDISWFSKSSTDHDSDGCQDAGEDMDDDNDGIIDTNDLCSRGYLGWTSSSVIDFDSDGCHDSNEDSDDDNDGVLDAIELQEGTNPLDSKSKPIDSFSVQIGNIDLSTWDIIGIITALITSGFLAFAFVTRNGRFDNFSSSIQDAEHMDFGKLETKLELASFFRLLSPRQSIKLESLLDAKKEKTALEVYLESNPTILEEQKEIPSLEKYAPSEVSVQSYPALDLNGVIGNDGYEWLNYPPNSQTHFYRIPGSDEWTLWE